MGIRIDNKLNFDSHVSDICTKVSQKLHALSRISQFLPFERRKEIMNAFIMSQFGYCPLVWIFHSRKLNHRINSLHERPLRLVYGDSKSSFDTLLDKNGSFKIHERNIQTLAIELYKVWYGMCPEIMSLVLPLNTESKYIGESDFSSRNMKTIHYGLDSLSHLGPKIEKLVPKKFASGNLPVLVNYARPILLE